ncbi:hypothetical protein ACTMTF_18430 [Nonomuraea sp. ZG12]|uniref:hypothetical protein n=1 Tax=Nonomuraea sp. ZG12 TaxID=3452207 RepID=UPI003F8AB50B
MIAETYRHGKPVGGWGKASQAFSEAGVPAQAPACSSETTARRSYGKRSGSWRRTVSGTASPLPPP